MQFLQNSIFWSIILGIPLGVFLAMKIPSPGSNYSPKIRRAIPELRFVPPSVVIHELEKEGVVFNKDTHCSVCGRQISSANFGAVRKKGEKQIFVCSKTRCMTLGEIVTSK